MAGGGGSTRPTAGAGKWEDKGEDGRRIRGEENKEAAELALVKEKLSWEEDAPGTRGGGQCLVSRVCSEYIQYCERGVVSDTLPIDRGAIDGDRCLRCRPPYRAR